MTEPVPKVAAAGAVGLSLVFGAPVSTALCIGGLLFLWRASSRPHSHAGHAAGPRLSEEGGWLIVELMIGAVVLVLAGLAIYAGLDGASKTSARNRSRTTAAFLAQQDQERMRTMDAAALAGYSSVSTQTVGGIKYTITSSATLVNDSSGSISCTNKSATAQYLRIRSSVADPFGKNAPVVQDSLLSPKPSDGNAAVQVVDRTGVTGVSGVPVTLNEPPSDTTNTDSNGCSLFSFLDNGTQYDVSFSLPGYVDVNGVNAIDARPITVVPGTVSVTQFQYDNAGQITIPLQTAVGGTVTCPGVSITDSHMTLSPPVRTFDSTSCGTSGGTTTSTATGLFPFTDQYKIYAGTCLLNDPSKYAQPSTFAPVLTAGGSVTQAFTEPMLSLTVQRKTFSGTSTYGNADVGIKASDSGCSGNVFNPPNADTNGSLKIGLPYGNYTVCADDGTYWTGYQSYANTLATGGSKTLTIDTTSSFNKGAC